MMRGAAPLVVVSIFIFIIIWKYEDITSMNNDDTSILKEIQNILPNKEPEKKIRTHEEYFDAIRKACGELCDFQKPIVPGDFLGTVSAKVDCEAIFNLDLIDKPSWWLGNKLPTWEQTPQMFKDIVTHYGQVDIREYWFGNTGLGVDRNDALVYDKSTIEYYIDSWNNGTPIDNYAGASVLTDEAANVVDVTGKNILVIGTQIPWLEAVLLTKNPKKVTTVEYGYFISEYPNLEFIRPYQLRERYLDGTLEKFDAIFTFSSVEHSGQGRYGDTLNPWGDVISIAQAWCVSTPDARLALGVPTNMNGRDIIDYNAHRIYGPVTYPFLVTNWVMEWPMEDSKRLDPSSADMCFPFQPYFIFKKQ